MRCAVEAYDANGYFRPVKPLTCDDMDVIAHRIYQAGVIRDVEMGYYAYIHVLIEHNQTGSSLRLAPTS